MLKLQLLENIINRSEIFECDLETKNGTTRYEYYPLGRYSRKIGKNYPFFAEGDRFYLGASS